jgi:hypothetical protein
MLNFFGTSKIKESDILCLVNLGFTKDQAISSLKDCENNVELAANYLLHKATQSNQ